MKKLPLKTAAFRYLEKSFGEWLDILGYAPTTVRSFPTYIREFLHYMENNGYTRINQIDIPLIKVYYRQLSQRSNQRRGGGLSNNYLNAHLNAIDLLLEYLRKQARIEIPPTGISKETPNPEEVIPLTMEQVKKLYEAADIAAEAKDEVYSRADRSALALRDKAMLAVFYDCGLRRTEGKQLNLSDIHYDNRLLEVRQGKGGKPRFVPLGRTTLKHLQDYQYEARPQFIKSATEEAFFLGVRGGRLTGCTFNSRLKTLQKYSDNAALRQMNLHLHILRHSIATHLLYKGMSLEKVAQFLGHYSLESTQIYTHLMEKVYG
ncbi:tyrosine recombinase XerD [Fulvivirga imtechensis AK7]|uniref:Tyrosine recombinase XerD n=1 Tax=Fulvivirga imtechensis AK7 TaxID=1237149 RepID=L8JT19_9BACT|nr:tyrosine-type recombinase/integrase [Fulvivirga imtechensis]ELR71338.1 tyrosine recombinase XerD [Fulvivirga imtechensis AK7]